MTHVVATFVENDRVVDGTVVVTRQDPDLILWAGPVHLCPIDSFPAGSRLHVHPALMHRIQYHVERVEPGGIATEEEDFAGGNRGEGMY